MTSACNKGFIPFLDMDALCGSERRQPPFGQTIKADLTLNLRPLIGEPWHSKIYRILSGIVVKYNSAALVAGLLDIAEMLRALNREVNLGQNTTFSRAWRIH
jgi:hypothetical protein